MGSGTVGRGAPKVYGSTCAPMDLIALIGETPGASPKAPLAAGVDGGISVVAICGNGLGVCGGVCGGWDAT